MDRIEERKKYIIERIKVLRPIFARAAIGDFSQDLPEPEGDDDEMTELYFGIQTMLEVIRSKISDLEMEIGEREEIENRLKARTKELADGQKALLNVLSDLEETKSEVEQEEAKYEALLNSVGQGVVATDKDGFIVFINSVAEKILGWSMEEIVAQKLTNVTKLEDKNGQAVPYEKRPLTLAMNSGKIISSGDYYYYNKNKKKFPVFITVSPIIMGEKIIGGIETFRDVTEEKELDRIKSEFISVASHQLRTPVSALNWITESLRGSLKNLDPKQKEYFEDFSISVTRLVRLVEDLLNVSRIELGTLQLDAKEIVFTDFVKNFMKAIKPYAELKDHELKFEDKSEDSLKVKIDPKVLNDIVQNLVSNGIDYSPAKTLVRLVLEKEGGYAKFSVFNNGQKIPDEEQAHLFGKFYRGESGKKIKQEGTGLGLYIVKSLVENSGGKIGFSSKKNETVFWFTLPIAK